MTSSNHSQDRTLQRDAKLWHGIAGVNYTTALRLLSDPLFQGILGDRVSVRDLLRTLDEHSVIGAGSASVLGRTGMNGDVPLRDELSAELLREAILATEFLRMFTPLTPEELEDEEHTWVNSYTLKHTAERLFGALHEYISNGALIWAAASLGLPLRQDAADSPNLLVGISRLEHDYVELVLGRWHGKWEHGEHFQPPRFWRLIRAVNCIASGRTLDEALATPLAMRPATSPFHDWVVQQAGRRGKIGVVAADYVAGFEGSEHRPVASPEDFLHLLSYEMFIPLGFYSAAERLVRDWRRRTA